MNYFDYQTAARKAGIPEETLSQWKAVFSREYPNDEMMMELRLFRACEAAAKVPGGFREVDESLQASVDT